MLLKKQYAQRSLNKYLPNLSTGRRGKRSLGIWKPRHAREIKGRVSPALRRPLRMEEATKRRPKAPHDGKPSTEINIWRTMLHAFWVSKKDTQGALMMLQLRNNKKWNTDLEFYMHWTVKPQSSHAKYIYMYINIQIHVSPWSQPRPDRRIGGGVGGAGSCFTHLLAGWKSLQLAVNGQNSLKLEKKQIGNCENSLEIDKANYKSQESTRTRWK